MPRPIRAFVRFVDRFNRVVGRVAMYLIYVMMGILLLSSISRTLFDVSFIWIIEMAQFTMAAYYFLGGGYSVQLQSHVRMDLLYSRLTQRGQAIADAITSISLVFYLVVLLLGGISSSHYALEYGQKNYSAWAPSLAPIKIIMSIGIFLMLLQIISTFFKDLAAARGETIE
jgi:TRAP-type mannitol/chloroaromatic compound transport system permease small subunit